LRALRLGGRNRARWSDIGMTGVALGSNAVSTLRGGRGCRPRSGAGERCHRAFSLISIGIELAIIQQTKRGGCRRAVHDRAMFRGGVLDDVILVCERRRGAATENDSHDARNDAGSAKSRRRQGATRQSYWRASSGAGADPAAAPEPKLGRATTVTQTLALEHDGGTAWRRLSTKRPDCKCLAFNSTVPTIVESTMNSR
jgi:hypothetical protein